MENSANPRDGRPVTGEWETVSGFLTAALNMEDQISRSVYEDYLDRANWPTHLDEDVFLRIQERLTPLVEDTKKHAKILHALIQEHANSE